MNNRTYAVTLSKWSMSLLASRSMILAIPHGLALSRLNVVFVGSSAKHSFGILWMLESSSSKSCSANQSGPWNHKRLLASSLRVSPLEGMLAGLDDPGQCLQ